MAMATMNTGNRGVKRKIPIIQLSDGIALPTVFTKVVVDPFIANSSGSATRVEFLVGTDNQNMSETRSELTTEGNSEVQAMDLSANITCVKQRPAEQEALKTAFNGKRVRIIYVVTDAVDERVDGSTNVVTVEEGDSIEITHEFVVSVKTNNVSGQENQTLISYAKNVGADADTIVLNETVVPA